MPVAHVVQLTLPKVAAKVSGAQAWQLVPVALKVPGLHWTHAPPEGANPAPQVSTGVTAFDAAEAGPVPALLLAVTVKV